MAIMLSLVVIEACLLGGSFWRWDNQHKVLAALCIVPFAVVGFALESMSETSDEPEPEEAG